MGPFPLILICGFFIFTFIACYIKSAQRLTHSSSDERFLVCPIIITQRS